MEQNDNVSTKKELDFKDYSEERRQLKSIVRGINKSQACASNTISNLQDSRMLNLKATTNSNVQISTPKTYLLENENPFFTPSRQTPSSFAQIIDYDSDNCNPSVI